MALSGPRQPARSGKARELVVLVHGYGADGGDLIGLADPLSQVLPDAAFVAPDGPQPCPGARCQWFPITQIDPRLMHQGVVGAAPVLQQFVESELARLSLTADRLALVGFSQGTMLSLHLGLGPLKPRAVVGFSGLLTAPPQSVNTPPPVLLTHGSSDNVIPADAMFATAATLGSLGVRVQWHLSPGMGHGIDDNSLLLAANFLRLAFAGRLIAEGPACSPVR